jgi:hypothetical protein
LHSHGAELRAKMQGFLINFWYFSLFRLVSRNHELITVPQPPRWDCSSPRVCPALPPSGTPQHRHCKIQVAQSDSRIAQARAYPLHLFSVTRISLVAEFSCKRRQTAAISRVWLSISATPGNGAGSRILDAHDGHRQDTVVSYAFGSGIDCGQGDSRQRKYGCLLSHARLHGRL